MDRILGGGLARRLGHGQFTSWSACDGLSHEVVWSIARQKTPSGPGPVWVGTEQGLNRIDPATGAIRHYFEADGLAGNVVNALASGEDGGVWAGSWPAALRTHAGRPPPASRRRGRRGRAVPSGGDPRPPRRGGLGRSRQRSLPSRARLARRSARARLDRPRQARRVRAFAEDPAGIVYAASKQGILRVNGPAPRRFTVRDGLREDFVSSIAIASDGSLVIAYREAIGGAKVILQGIGSPSGPSTYRRAWSRTRSCSRDAARRARVDRHGLGGRRVRPDWARSARYGKADGMISDDLSQRVLRRPRRHRLAGLEPGPDTLARGFPRRRSRRQCHHHLSEPGTGGWIRRRAVLGPGDRNFSVAWAGLTFIDPSKVRFRYRMIGLVDQYTETDLIEARFPALPTGDYRFEVLCVSALGKVPPARRLRARGSARVVADPLGADPLGLLAAAVIALSCGGARGIWRRTAEPGGSRRGAERRARRGQPGAARGLVHRCADRRSQPALLLDGHRGRRQPDAARPLDAAGQPPAQLRPDLLHRRHRPLQGGQRRLRPRPRRRRARRNGPPAHASCATPTASSAGAARSSC